ncbi:hypothetical protein MGG_06452 [Pyricularia oryzae 70-15]|uniref:Pheromone receptor n=4 Tax=Pyricularia oryzae TaxID=318829 RepID=G4N785_PYRO7|nr:uncharacterized protein MGG_06452 [Pyricularia oryzae 70-15]ELQ41887.1 pheromone receptor [Pyricularia oryzae Y34]KAI7925328.1 hypothetical protein M9X92_003313 [Pyricularia oryzae]EHA50795.1 hypothetical protein MGG_06452 [Pyricularia oryzae 70-15]KAI7925960.1 hypothetical protein M0657_003932 [Pyricularia oryzae]QBZ61358.1 hypothetical protein PoMZ_08307 [Pyricularia oryzae]
MSTDPDIQYGLLAAELASPGLVVDLVLRVSLATVAIIATWVPFRLLWRSGEFAAALLAANIIITNFITIIQALIWRDDAALDGYRGQGWCDVQAYINIPLSTMYATSIFAVIQHVSAQVSLRRATGLSRAEKRRRNLIQALIIFPVPIIQVALSYPVHAYRYSITTLQGCDGGFEGNLLTFFFFLLPIPVYVIGASIYAIITHFQFRKLSTGSSVIQQNNSGAAARSNRARRKLYLMTVSIVAPYLPIQIAFLVINLMNTQGWFRLYSWEDFQSQPTLNGIMRVPSWEASWISMRVCYIAILSAIPIFVFFGTTKDAVNTWRGYCLALGLGKIFPRLKEEYDPDRPRGTQNTNTLQSWGTGSIVSATDRKASVARDGPHSPSGSDHFEEIQLPNIDTVAIAHAQPAQLRPYHGSDGSGNGIGDEESSQGRDTFSLKKMPVPIPRIGRWSSRSKPRASDDDTAPLGGSAARRVSPSSNRSRETERLEAPGGWEPSPSSSMVETRVWSDDLESGLDASRGRERREPSPHEVLVKTHIATCSTSQTPAV